MPEEILGTLHEVSGHTFDTIYDLYFTTDRIIVVLIRNPGEVIPSVSWFSIFISSWSSRRKEEKERDEIAAKRHRKLHNLSPDELLMRNPNGNFQIRNNDIVNFEIKRDILFQYHIKFLLNISGKNIPRNFTINKNQISEAKQLLTKVFPAKLKT